LRLHAFHGDGGGWPIRLLLDLQIHACSLQVLDLTLDLGMFGCDLLQKKG